MSHIKTSFTYMDCPPSQHEPFERELAERFGILGGGAVSAVMLRWIVVDIPPSREAELLAIAKRHDIEITDIKHVTREVE